MCAYVYLSAFVYFFWEYEMNPLKQGTDWNGYFPAIHGCCSPEMDIWQLPLFRKQRACKTSPAAIVTDNIKTALWLYPASLKHKKKSTLLYFGYYSKDYFISFKDISFHIFKASSDCLQMAVSLLLSASLAKPVLGGYITCPYPHMGLKLLVALQQVLVEGDRVPMIIAEGSVEVFHSLAQLTWKLHERRHTKNKNALKMWNYHYTARREVSTTHPLNIS